jgi:hypothetical protein
MTEFDSTRRITSGAKEPVSSQGVFFYDEEPGPEQKIRKWALELAVELLKSGGNTHTYVLDVAEKFELFIASAERSD